MKEIFIHILGMFLICSAVFYNREGKSEIHLFTWKWVVIMILIISGGILLKLNL